MPDWNLGGRVWERSRKVEHYYFARLRGTHQTPCPLKSCVPPGGFGEEFYKAMWFKCGVVDKTGVCRALIPYSGPGNSGQNVSGLLLIRPDVFRKKKADIFIC